MSDETDTTQQQTLRQLVDAKQEAREAVLLAESEREESHYRDSNNDFRAQVNGRIRAFLRELRAVRKNFDADGDAEEYWNEKSIGAVRLPDDQTISLDGIDDLLSLNQPINVTVQKPRPGYGGGDEQVTVQYYPRTEIYVSGYFLGVEWMSAVGLIPNNDGSLPLARGFDQSTDESNSSAESNLTNAEMEGSPDL